MGESADIAATHGIQLLYVGVKELHFESSRLPNTFVAGDFEEMSFSTAKSTYDPETKQIAVFTKLEAQAKSKEAHIRVELVGQFIVDETLFPAERVDEWAEKAAFFVLTPFLREQVYALTCRVGLPQIMLPLLHVPTFKLVAPHPGEMRAEPELTH